MKILLVNGSPREDGCTYTALAEMAECFRAEGAEATIYHIGAEPVAPCKACRGCARAKKCVIQDKVNEFVELAREYDGYVIGSPVHYASASGSLVAFMDRAFFSDYVSGHNSFAHKPAAAVASARRAGTTATLDQINKYFTISQMPIISGRYWNMVHGFTPDDVRKDAEGLQNLRYVARNMVYHLRCKEAAAAAGILPPEQEKPVYTHFIH